MPDKPKHKVMHPAAKKELCYIIEYRVEASYADEGVLVEALDKLREVGAAEITDVFVEELKNG